MALSANAALDMKNGPAKIQTVTLNTSVVCYKNALLAVAPGDSGAALIPANSTTQKFAGVALRPVGQAAFPVTGDGTQQVDVGFDVTVKVTLKTGVTAGHVGSIMYCVDDATVTHLATIGPQCGKLVEYVSATSGWVHIGLPALAVAS